MKRKPLFLLITAAVLLITGTAVAVFSRDNPNSLPKSIIGLNKNFTFYYFAESTPPGQLSLKKDSTKFSNGILVFSLENSRGDTVAITQQKLPHELTNSTLQGDEAFETTYGRATLSSLPEGRTTGSLTTNDGTLILLNTNSPIELNTLKDLLRSLKPL